MCFSSSDGSSAARRMQSRTRAGQQLLASGVEFAIQGDLAVCQPVVGLARYDAS